MRNGLKKTSFFVSSSTPAGHQTGHFTGTDGSITHTATSFQPVLAETLPANRAEIINPGGRLSYQALLGGLGREKRAREGERKSGCPLK